MAAVDIVELLINLHANLEGLKDAQTDLLSLDAQVKELDNSRIRLPINIPGAKALSELAAVDLMAEKLDGKDVDLDVKANTKGAVTDLTGMATISSLMGLGTTKGGGGGKTGILDSLRELDLNMSSMHNMLADIIPLLVVFIGALAPLIAGLIGLATAAVLASVALLGIAGLMGVAFFRDAGGATEAMDELKEIAGDLLDIIAPLAEKFLPMVEDTISGIERFVDRLVAEGSSLLQIRDEARAFGRAISNALVSLVDLAVDTTEAYAPVFSMIADFFRNIDPLVFFTNVLADIMPVLPMLVSSMINLGKAIVEVGTGFLFVTVAVFKLFGLFWHLITSIINLVTWSDRAGEIIGLLVGTLFALFSISLIILNIWKAYIVVLKAYLLLKKSEILLTVKDTAVKYANAAATWVATQSMKALAFWTGVFIGIITLGIGLIPIATAAIADLGSKFSILGGDIRGATNSLREFGSASGEIGGGFGGAGVGVNTPSGMGASGGIGGNAQVVNIYSDDPDRFRREARKVFHRERAKEDATSR